MRTRALKPWASQKLIAVRSTITGPWWQSTTRLTYLTAISAVPKSSSPPMPATASPVGRTRWLSSSCSPTLASATPVNIMAVVPRVIIRRREAPVLPANRAGRRPGRSVPPARPAIWRLVHPMFPVFPSGASPVSRLLSYQWCSRALDHGPRQAQRCPARAQPSAHALCEVRHGAVAGRASEVRARYGAGTGGPNAQQEYQERSSVTVGGAAPNRTSIHPVESVKRLLSGAVDDNGGRVPGLAGNTMLPAYCSADPFG